MITFPASVRHRHRLMPVYTAWWKEVHTCKQLDDGRCVEWPGMKPAGCMLQIASPTPACCTTMPHSWQLHTIVTITSAKEDMFSSLFVCLFVSNFAQKLPNGFAWNFQAKLAMGKWTKWLDFSGDPDYRLNTGIVFRIRHYWEIWKVVNGHKSAAHNDAPDGGTGKTCLGGGMHCPSASSLNCYCRRQHVDTTVQYTVTWIETGINHSPTGKILPLSCPYWQFHCCGWCRLRGKRHSSDREYLELWPRIYSVVLSRRYPLCLATAECPTTAPRCCYQQQQQ